MKINEINGELIMKMGLVQNIVKKQAGDGMEFQIMMQSMLEAMGKASDEKVKNGGMITGVGQQLDKLEMVLKNNGGYKNNQWNSNINKDKENNKDKVTTDKINNSVATSNIPKDQTAVRKQINKSVEKYSKVYGVDPKFVFAVIKAESNFNPKCTSSAGAMGVMQLMPVTAKEEGVTNAYDIDQNIRGGISQLSKHLKKYNGNKEMALMAYNAGAGTVQRRGVKSPSDLYKMPKETRNYVPKVMGYYRSNKI